MPRDEITLGSKMGKSPKFGECEKKGFANGFWESSLTHVRAMRNQSCNHGSDKPLDQATVVGGQTA